MSLCFLAGKNFGERNNNQVRVVIVATRTQLKAHIWRLYRRSLERLTRAVA